MNKKVLIGIISGILLVVIVVIFCLLKNNVDIHEEDDNPLQTNIIVIKNNDNLYALYDTEGKQVTDFEYKYVSDFSNNHAEVKNKNDEVGIINNKGKMSVNFGKYKYISKKGCLYEVSDQDYKDYLINSEGKVIYDLEEKEVDTFTTVEELVVVTSSDKIDVLDYTGKSIIRLDYNPDEEYKVYSGEENYASFFYNNTSYIIDLYKGKITNKISSSVPYVVSSVNKLDEGKYVIASNDEKNKEYIYMNNTKEVFRTNTCTNLFFEWYNPNLISAKSDGKRYIVDENGNDLLEIYKSNINYIDAKNYIMKNGSKITDFYTDGEVVKTIENTQPYITANKIQKVYILKNVGSTNKDTYSYYSINGEKIIDTDYKKASEFDRNNIASVSDDGKHFYLINLKGQKISDEYDYIEPIVASTKPEIYNAKKGDKGYALNNLGKEILATEGRILEEDNYLVVQEKGKEIYYTLEGKEFYTLQFTPIE